MDEKALGRALLDLDMADASGTAERRALARSLLANDRRRVRRLAAATIAIWLISLVLIGVVLVWFALLFPEQAKFRMEVERGGIATEERIRIQGEHMVTFQMGTLLIAFSVFVLALAALSTVVLLLASRRATLRQINANLLEISEQLRASRPAPAP
jgi:hypothetical protein